MATHKKRYTAQEWFDRAILFRNTGELHKAADACRCAIILNPLNPDYHIHLARSLRSLDKCEEAIWVLKRAIKLSPNEPTAIHLLNTLEKRKVGAAPIGYIESLFDHYAATFDHCMNGVLKYRVPKILEKRIKRITAKRGKFNKTLDLGCGTGLTGKILRPHTHQLVGVDVSQKMLERASKKKIYDSIVCDDIINYLNQQKEKIDLAVAADVFIYLGDIKKVFNLVNKRLQKTGIFAFSVESINKGSFELRKSGRFAHAPNHIIDILSQNQFSVLTRETTGLRMEKNSWINGDIFLVEKQPAVAKEIHRPKSIWDKIQHIQFGLRVKR